MSQLRELVKTKHKIVGLRQVKREIDSVKQIVLAENADPVLKAEVEQLCGGYGIELMTFPSKEELGTLCGIEVACAVVGLTAQTVKP